MKTLTAYIISLLLCLGIGSATAYCGGTDGEVTTEVAVKVSGGNVIVDNPTQQPVEVLVYSITGSLMRIAKAPAGDALYLDLPSGIYIVKAGTNTKRVSVRQ